MNREGLQTVKGAIRNGKEGTGQHLVTHGAYSLVRSYYSNGIDRRTTLGIQISEWESDYARHLGYDRLDECPITLRNKIRLAIAQELFLMTFQPEPDSRTGAASLRSAENLLNRLSTELGLKPTPKPVQSIDDYLEEKYGEEEG